MNEVLINLLQFVLVYFMIKWLFVIVENQIITKKARNQELLDRMSELVHKVKVEKYGDQYYWFDEDSDSFIVQGKSLNEIIHKIKISHKEHIFITQSDEIICAPNWHPMKKII